MAFTINPAVAPRNPEHQRHLQIRAERIRILGNRLSGILPDDKAVTLEIGSGHGHFLTAYASAHSEAFCLGIDLVSRRVEKAEEKRAKRKLANLQFLKAEVTEFLEAWPRDRLLERCFILFPDPWPKKRHTKNRVLQPLLLETIAGIAASGASLHFRSDHAGCFAWGREQIATHPCWEISPTAPWPFETPSYFEELAESHRSLTARLRSFAGAGA